MKKLHIAYGHDYLNWRLGGGHPTNPERATLATAFIEHALGAENITILTPEAHHDDVEKLYSIHDPAYVDEVVYDGRSPEWYDSDIELGKTALQMFAGTARLAEKMFSGEATVAFNPQGAKHHAHYDTSGGFCVFNDMAWAATEFGKRGMRVMYIDWDAHHGDGVEELLYNTEHLTASIHDGTIFPGTGRSGHDEKNFAYNWALDAKSGDIEFKQAIDEIEALADTYKPDVILLATGADAHETDPLSTLRFTEDGYTYAAKAVARIASKHTGGRVLIGGAGGYQPHTHTPRIWADVVTTIYTELSAEEAA